MSSWDREQWRLHVKASLYERRASLQRILDSKERRGQRTELIRDLYEANEADIALYEGRGPERTWEEEAAVNAEFMRINGL